MKLFPIHVTNWHLAPLRVDRQAQRQTMLLQSVHQNLHGPSVSVKMIGTEQIITGMILLGGGTLHHTTEMFLLGGVMTFPLGTVMLHHRIGMHLLINGMILPGVIHPEDPAISMTYSLSTMRIAHGPIVATVIMIF